MSKNLSNISDTVTEQTNTIGVLTSILEFDPKDRTDLVTGHVILGRPTFQQ